MHTGLTTLRDIALILFKIHCCLPLSEFMLFIWLPQMFFSPVITFFAAASFFFFFMCRARTHLRWICWVKAELNWHALGLVLLSRSIHLLQIAKMALITSHIWSLQIKQSSLCKLVAIKSLCYLLHVPFHVFLLSSAIYEHSTRSPLLCGSVNAILVNAYLLLL